jgi:putative Mn2+ efflux pump MntP
MAMSSDTWKALGLISIYTALLFFLIGWAGARKMQFHDRAEIATAGYYAAGIFVTLGVVMILLSFRGKRS